MSDNPTPAEAHLLIQIAGLEAENAHLMLVATRAELLEAEADALRLQNARLIAAAEYSRGEVDALRALLVQRTATLAIAATPWVH